VKVTDRVLHAVSSALAARTSRRGFLARTAVIGSALSVGPWSFLTRPGTAYAAVCGIDSTCSSGYTVFCATITNGVNRCPPGSLVGGWWKSDGSGFCCGGARYYVDCHSYCSCGCGGRRRFCGEGCRNCSCGCGPAGQCDQRKVCCNEFRYGQCNQDVDCTGPVWCRVVTCTPPWKIPGWECTTTSATDQRTNAHSAPTLQDCTPIGREYTAIGGPGSVLGEQRTPELGTPAPGGTYQLYHGGSIYHSAATGAHEVHGAILEKFGAFGWEAGPLGYPTTDELGTPDGRGRFNHFERGSIYHSPDSGTNAVLGGIRETWRALGWEAGPLGYPVTDELGTPDGRGRYNHFTGADGAGNASVYWTEATGAHAVVGAVRDAWAHLGWEGGRLGFPTTGETTTPDGRAVYNHFERGSIYSSAATGAHAVSGPILELWRGTGWETGRLGLPTTDEAPVAGGSFENFEEGSVYLSAATGAHTVAGPVRTAWLDDGGPAGPWGFPAAEPVPDSGGRVRQRFQGGTAVLDVATGRVTFD
jgi:uncharacterized protein with LGFP repeats